MAAPIPEPSMAIVCCFSRAGSICFNTPVNVAAISWIERVITVDAMLRRVVRSSNSEQGIWQFVFSHCETSVKSVLSSAANLARSSAFISFGVKNISGRPADPQRKSGKVYNFSF